MICKARLSLICIVTVAALAVGGCGGSTTTDGGGASASSSPNTGSAAASATSQPGAKVSANAASENDIASALTGAGVSNAERWAKEVVEYRPYPADDPNLAKLRDNLVKYNPGQETVDKIVSVLTP